MTKVYRVEVEIAATMYVKASSPEEALEKAQLAKTLSLAEIEENELFTVEEGFLPISGRKYDDPELPELSLSPAMTLTDIDPDQEVECVHDE